MIRKRLQATEQPAPAPHPESPGKPVFFSSFGRSSPSLGTCQPNEAVNVLHPPCPTINFPINARTPGIYQATVLTLNIKPHLLIYIGKPATVLQPDQTGKGPGQVLFEIKKYKHPSRPAPCTSAPISINIQHNQRWFFLKQPLMKHRPQASQGGMRAPGPTKEHEPLSKLTGNDHAKAFAPIQNS